MAIEPHHDVLRRAAKGALPSQVKGIDAVVVKDLIASGHMAGGSVSTLDGPAFLEPRITIPGREYLATLDARVRDQSSASKVRKHLPATVKWTMGMVAAIITLLIGKRFIG